MKLPAIVLPHGAFSDIARSFDPPLSPQHVAEVASGRRTSRRVRVAVEAYERRGEPRRRSSVVR